MSNTRSVNEKYQTIEVKVFWDLHQVLFQNNQYLRSFFTLKEFVDNARLNLDKVFFQLHMTDKSP